MSPARNNGAVVTNITGLALSLLLLAPVWGYGTAYLIPQAHRFDLLQLVPEIWERRHDLPYLQWLSPQLNAWGYPYAFLATVIPSVLFSGALISVSHGTRWSLLHSVAGLAAGIIVGFLVSWLVPLPEGLAVIAMPSIGFGLGLLVPMAMAPVVPADEVPVIRGTRIVPYFSNITQVMAEAKRKGMTVFAGVLLDRATEVRHFGVVGVTGSGKSVAILQLMATALQRGDRQIVVDPDGSAMALFWKPGDVILNPFDARSVKWDPLAELQGEDDYKFLAETLISATGVPEHDTWVDHARTIFTACLRSWVEAELGSSDDFLRVMGTATNAQLGKLTEGSAAHLYFKDGAEKMLANVMATLVPSLSGLEHIADCQGEPFSVREWVRTTTHGTIWIPFRAIEIPKMRSLVSCWMRLAITETLTLDVDPTDQRRIWFQIDELDALGRIDGLKDALVRMRKKGGAAVLGFQAIAMVRKVYGEAEAHAIVENLDNKLFLRCNMSEGGGTAKFASDVIGEREVERQEATTSRTVGQHPSSSTTFSNRRHVEKAVLPAELTQLADRTGLLKLATRKEWLRVKFDWVAYPSVIKAFLSAGPRRRNKAE